MNGIDRSKCNLCKRCAEVCPSGAIEQIGKYMTKEEVVGEIEKDLIFYRSSGGGVTFSGGEPALQSEFVRSVARSCRKKAIHVALDTSGAVGWDRLERILPDVDLCLYDLKHMDPQRHREGTGSSNDLILDNLIKVSSRIRTWLRIPIIPGYNDSLTDVENVAKFSRRLSIENVSLLPYHSAGELKYQRLGQAYCFKNTPLPEDEQIERLKQMIEKYGHPVTIGR